MFSSHKKKILEFGFVTWVAIWTIKIQYNVYNSFHIYRRVVIREFWKLPCHEILIRKQYIHVICTIINLTKQRWQNVNDLIKRLIFVSQTLTSQIEWLDPFRSNTNKNNAKTLYLQVKQKDYHCILLEPEHFLANNVWVLLYGSTLKTSREEKF